MFDFSLRDEEVAPLPELPGAGIGANTGSHPEAGTGGNSRTGSSPVVGPSSGKRKVVWQTSQKNQEKVGPTKESPEVREVRIFEVNINKIAFLHF